MEYLLLGAYFLKLFGNTQPDGFLYIYIKIF